jgi:hypothetical protein
MLRSWDGNCGTACLGRAPVILTGMICQLANNIDRTVSVLFGNGDGTFTSQVIGIGAQPLAGQSCSVSVTFTPLATGSRTGSLSVADNGGASRQTATLVASGS